MLRLVSVASLLLLVVLSAAAWTWPVRGPVLESFSFDPARPYAAGQHRGIAIGADAGAPVLAPAARRRHLRRLGTDEREDGHDRHRRRACGHPHPPRLGRRRTRRERRGGRGRRHGRPERRRGARRPVRPSRHPHRLRGPGLPRSARVPAGACASLSGRARRRSRCARRVGGRGAAAGDAGRGRGSDDTGTGLGAAGRSGADGRGGRARFDARRRRPPARCRRRSCLRPGRSRLPPPSCARVSWCAPARRRPPPGRAVRRPSRAPAPRPPARRRRAARSACTSARPSRRRHPPRRS